MTPVTATLLQLLARFSRQEISQALAVLENPQSALQDDLAVLTARMRPRKRSDERFSRTSSHRIVGFFDHDFPALLREIPDPPLVLYCRGSLDALAHDAPCPSIAIVGARRCTHAGAGHARQMARELAECGICIVSGLALGIDGAAHRGALAANGVSVAFLGGSLEELYPREHDRLAASLVEAGGAIVSEYPPGTGPRPHQFPERNRLISGAATATVLIEASEKSGSLITARLGLEQGRDVFAMPGPVSSNVSRGCHRLLKQGAGLVTCADDVFAELGFVGPPAARPVTAALSPDHAALLEFVDAYPKTLDEIVIARPQSGAPAARIAELLVELELDGFVQQTPLGYIRMS